MEAYGKILLFAMPVFLMLVLFEKWYGWKKGNDTMRTMDMISSLTSGVTNVTKDVLGLSVAIYSYGWMADHWAIIHIQASFWLYFIAFFALDFSGYWIHRIAHKYNFFWNNHIIHHSSEEFNLACALRQNVSVFVKIFAILLLPASLLGVPENVIAVVAPLHLFIQFWYHTQHINKMGFLEKIIVTPSHHRVHHAINKEYIDKNYSQVLIIWDKIFGTFQEELETVKPVYGITRPVQTWNPIKINFVHMWLLISDAWRTKSIKDKFRIWLMPTGWRPEDVVEKYPVYKIDDVYHFQKYNTESSFYLKIWCWFQMLMLLFFVSYLFANLAPIGSPGIYVYGLFVFLFVYALTELMDNNPNAYWWELLKSASGLAIIANQESWLHVDHMNIFISAFLLIYMSASLIVSFLFSRKIIRVS